MSNENNFHKDENERSDEIHNKRHEYYEKNKEKIKEREAKRYLENPNKKKEVSRNYYYKLKNLSSDLLSSKICMMTEEEKTAILLKIAEKHTNFFLIALDKDY